MNATNVVKSFEQLDRETLVVAGREYLDTIRRQMTYEPSRDGVAILLLRSLQRMRTDDPEKSPLYKVCKWLSSHALTGYRNNAELRKAIKKDTKISYGGVVEIFKRIDLKLPPHLKHAKWTTSQEKTRVVKTDYSLKTVTDAPTGMAPGEPPSLTLPPNIKELTLKASGFELTLKFQ